MKKCRLDNPLITTSERTDRIMIGMQIPAKVTLGYLIVGRTFGFPKGISIGAEFTSSTSLIPIFPEVEDKDKVFQYIEMSLKIFNWKSMYQRSSNYMDLVVDQGIGIYQNDYLLSTGDEFRVYQIYDTLYLLDIFSLVSLFGDEAQRTNITNTDGNKKWAGIGAE